MDKHEGKLISECNKREMDMNNYRRYNSWSGILYFTEKCLLGSWSFVLTSNIVWLFIAKFQVQDLLLEIFLYSKGIRARQIRQPKENRRRFIT